MKRAEQNIIVRSFFERKKKAVQHHIQELRSVWVSKLQGLCKKLLVLPKETNLK